MTIPLTYSPRAHKRAVRDWQKHQPQLKVSYEPSYYVADQISTVTPDGKPVLLSGWVNGRPVIMPPADLVSLMVHDPASNRMVSYLITQADLLMRLGGSAELETFPTVFYQIDALSPARRDAILARAWKVNEVPVAA